MKATNKAKYDIANIALKQTYGYNFVAKSRQLLTQNRALQQVENKLKLQISLQNQEHF